MAGYRVSSFAGRSTSPTYSKVVFATVCALVLSAIVTAQTTDDSVPQAPSASQSAPASPPSDTTRMVIPVGTRIPLVLTHPLNSNSVKTGDAVFAQIATPVVVDDQVAVPAGTFVRGKVESLTRRGTRAEVVVRSASLVMGSSLVDMGGPVRIESEEWTAEQSKRKIQGGDRSDSDGCHATGGADRTCGGWQDNDVCWRHAVYHAIAQGPGDWNDGGIRRWSGYCIRLDGAQPWLLSGGRYAAGDHTV